MDCVSCGFVGAACELNNNVNPQSKGMWNRCMMLVKSNLSDNLQGSIYANRRGFSTSVPPNIKFARVEPIWKGDVKGKEEEDCWVLCVIYLTVNGGLLSCCSSRKRKIARGQAWAILRIMSQNCNGGRG